MLVISLVLFLAVVISIKVADDWIRQKQYRKAVVVGMFFMAVVTMLIGVIQFMFG